MSTLRKSILFLTLPSSPFSNKKKFRIRFLKLNISFFPVRLQRQRDGACRYAPRRKPHARDGAQVVHGQRDGAQRAPPLLARQARLPLPPEHRTLLHARPGGHCHAWTPSLLRHEVRIQSMKDIYIYIYRWKSRVHHLSSLRHPQQILRWAQQLTHCDILTAIADKLPRKYRLKCEKIMKACGGVGPWMLLCVYVSPSMIKMNILSEPVRISYSIK